MVIPTYNRKNLVREAITSVAKQTWPKVEIIVVDDGSTDGTVETLANLPEIKDPKSLKIIRQENFGVASARNTGLEVAEGEFIFFLDSDDLIFADALSKLVTALQQNKAPYCLAHIHVSDIDRNILDHDRTGISRQPGESVSSGHWMTHAALYRRETLLRSGCFNSRLRHGEDTEFQWRVTATSGSGILIPAYLGLRRLHSYGHLSINRSDIETIRHSVNAMDAFVDWKQGRTNLSISTDFRYLASVAGLGIRAGVFSDWQCKDKAFALPLGLVGSKSIMAKAVARLGTPNNRFYFLILFALFAGAKGFRDVYRQMRGLPYRALASLGRKLNGKHIKIKAMPEEQMKN